MMGNIKKCKVIRVDVEEDRWIEKRRMRKTTGRDLDGHV